MRRKMIYAVIGMIGIGRICQAQSHAADSRPVLDVDDSVLQKEYHIAPTPIGWMGALQHERSDVRAFAALRLAAVGYKEAVPSILAAMATEPVPGTRVSLATAAARLGASDGVAALERMCQDPSWDPSLRVTAAYAALDAVGAEGCAGSVLEVLRARRDDQAAVQALHLVSRFKRLTPAQVAETRSLLVASLASESAAIRTGASYALRETGGTWAADQLRNAIKVEADDTVRRIMSADLAHVEAK